MKCETCGAPGAEVDLDFQAVLCPRCLHALNIQYAEDTLRHGFGGQTWVLIRLRGLWRALWVKWLTWRRRYVGPYDQIKREKREGLNNGAG